MKLTIRASGDRTDPTLAAHMVSYGVDGVSPDMSFLEMLDVLNEDLILRGEDPVAFDHDCREGICGIVRRGDQRPRPRPGADDHLPAPHAAASRDGDVDRRRALASQARSR